MEPLFIYVLKTIGFSAIMLAYYWLFLKDKTFHHYNRFYLLLTLLLSLLLPLIKVDYFTIEVNPNLYLLLDSLQQTNTTHNTSTYGFSYSAAAFATLGMVALFLISRFLLGIYKIQSIKKQYPKENIGNIDFYSTDLENAPFSFFKNIFWKNSILLNSDLGKQILKHEMVHVQQKHSWDKVLIEVLSALFWFNPFFYLIKKEITIIHEYLADKKTLNPTDTKAFAQMLLASQFNGNILPGTSPFLNSNIKKRLKMLKTPKTKFGYARRILALPLLFVITFALFINAKNKEIEKTNLKIETIVSQIKKDTINPKIESSSTKSITVDDYTKNTDTIKSKIDNPYYISEINYTENPNPKAGQPMADEMQKSTENDIFTINGEKVSKQDFQKYLDENIGNKNSSYRYSKNNIGGYTIRYFGASNNNLKDDDRSFNEYLEQIQNAKKEEASNNRELAESARKVAVFNLQNSKAEKIQAEKAAQAANKAAEEANKYINSREFKKQMKKTQKAAKEASNYVNSKEFKKEMEKVRKEAEEAAKFQIKSTESGDLKFFSFDDKNSKYFIGTRRDENGNFDSPQIFVNGVEYTGDLNEISPNDIQSIYVNKNKDVNDAGTINIITKKKTVPNIK